MATYADMQEIFDDIRSDIGIGLEKHGFIDRAEHYANTCGTTRRGIRVADAALGPETTDDSISLGQAVATRAVADLYALVQKTT